MNIQATLAKCRAELKRQKEMEAKATPGPWHPERFRTKSETKATLADMRYKNGGYDNDLLCLARNLNPARLAVADRMLAGIDDSNPSAEWFVDVAAHLLGVEVVE